jgi:hypothetical protein
MSNPSRILEFITCPNWGALLQVTENTGRGHLGIANATYLRIIRVCGGEVMETELQDWRALSEAASREQDPEKLMELVEQLNRALLHRELQMKRCLSAKAN